MKYVQKHFWKEQLRALQVFLCALVSRLIIVCARTRAQLRGNIGPEASISPKSNIPPISKKL